MELLVTETNANFKNYKKVSWSEYSSFKNCKKSWFCSYYAKLLGVPFTREHTLALSGIIIQKLFEIFINERVYYRYDNYQDLLDWFKSGMYGIYEIIVFPYKDQLDMANPRYYFRRNVGKNRIIEVRDKFSMDPLIKGFSPVFIDDKIFSSEFVTKDRFFDNLYKDICSVLESWKDLEIDLNLMLSEVYIRTKFYGDVYIHGQIDFLYNKSALSNFEDINQIRDKYILIDGKWKLSDFTLKEQLFFYSSLVYRRYKKLPEMVSFYSWTQREFKNYEFPDNFFETLKNEISQMIEVAVTLREECRELARKKIKTIMFDDFFNSIVKNSKVNSKNCFFCGVREFCDDCSYDRKSHIGANNKRQTEKVLIEKGLCVDKGIQDFEM